MIHCLFKLFIIIIIIIIIIIVIIIISMWQCTEKHYGTLVIIHYCT